MNVSLSFCETEPSSLPNPPLGTVPLGELRDTQVLSSMNSEGEDKGFGVKAAARNQC